MTDEQQPNLHVVTDSLADQAEEATSLSRFGAIEPWPDQVDGAVLLDELCAYFERPIVLPPGGREVCALYAVMTWMTDLLTIVPYLNFRSATKRAGKSNLGTLMYPVVRRPVLTANASPAYIFRQLGSPTLIIDEGDTFVQLNEELRGILDAGNDRDRSVGRTTQRGRDHIPTDFSPFGPKIICGIGDLPDTVTDRSIVVDLRRKKPTDTVERFNRKARARYRAQGELLRRKIVRWVGDNWDALDAADPAVPEELDDRAQDNWEPLLMVADVAKGHWSWLDAREHRSGTARQIAKLVSTGVDTGDEIELLLHDVQAIFTENRPYEHHVITNGVPLLVWMPGHQLTPSELVRRLILLEERPWSAYGQRQVPITTNQVGTLLRRAGIQSKVTRVNAAGSQPIRLYWPQLFEDAWERFGTCATCEPTYTT